MRRRVMNAVIIVATIAEMNRGPRALKLHLRRSAQRSPQRMKPGRFSNSRRSAARTSSLRATATSVKTGAINGKNNGKRRRASSLRRGMLVCMQRAAMINLTAG